MGIPPGKEKIQPLWKRYFGDDPFPAGRLTSAIWDRALAVGLSCPRDFLGLDVDVKDGKRGDEHLIALERELGPLPPGPVAETRSGGQHRLFTRRQLLHGVKFRSHVGLHDGADADIDVIHGGYRYFRVHEAAFWLSLDRGAVPEIPFEWHRAVRSGAGGRPRRPKRARSVESAASRSGEATPLPGALDELLARVRDTDLNRNVALNRYYFQAVLLGYDSEETRDAFRRAALDTGLPLSEIDATLDSAGPRATEKRAFFSQWQSVVESLTGSESAITRHRLAQTASALTAIAVLAEDPDAVGLSCRELGERLNVSRATAQRYLTKLRSLGLLRTRTQSRHLEAARYQLIIPVDRFETVAHALQYRLSQPGPVRTPAAEGRMQLHRISQHDAFARLGKGLVLPPSCALILAAVQGQPATARELTSLTGYSRRTIRRNLRILESAGLVSIDSSDRSVQLLDEDPIRALDQWAESMGASGRREARKEGHRDERERHAEWQHMREDRWERMRRRWPKLAEREQSTADARVKGASGRPPAPGAAKSVRMGSHESDGEPPCE